MLYEKIMNGKQIRSQIDADNVKGLLWINGGGAALLLTLLPVVLNNSDYAILAKPIIIGIFVFALGTIAVLIHNHLRRRCSLAYDCGKLKFKFLCFGVEPKVCHWSNVFMFLSYLFFGIATLIVCIRGCVALSSSGKENMQKNRDSNETVPSAIDKSQTMINSPSSLQVQTKDISGGIHTQNLQINSPSQSRKLIHGSKEQLLNILNQNKEKSVEITAVMGNQEAFTFAVSIKEFLQSKGYNPKGVNQAIFSKPIKGQIINPEGEKIKIIIGTK